MIGKPHNLLIPAVITACVVIGCGKNPVGPTGSGRGMTSIYDKTVVTSAENGFTLADVSGSTYTFDVTGSIPEISEGSLIVGTENGGYLRRVISASRAEGKLIIETKRASLTDAVIFGSADTVINIGAGSRSNWKFSGNENHRQANQQCTAPRVTPPHGGPEGIAQMNPVYLAPGVAFSGGGLDLSGLTLYSGEIEGYPSEVTITGGFIGFDPCIDIGIRINCKRVKEFHAIAEGTLHFMCDVAVDLAGAVEGPKEILLASLNRTFIQYIGRVPLVGLITLSFTAGFEFTGEYVGNCQTSLGCVTGISLGAEYSDGAWSNVNTIDTQFDAIPFDCENYADTGMKVYVRPSLNVSFYKVPAADIECTPYLEIAAETVSIPVWEWKLYGGITGQVGFYTEILDGKFADYSANPLNYRIELDSGPFATDMYVLVTMWGSYGDGDHQFEYPRGIAINADGTTIYVVDHLKHKVQKFAPDSTFLGVWGEWGSGDGQFSFPGKVAVDAAGSVYVVDNENHRVQKFHPDGTFAGKWGSEGGGDDQFKDPQGIGVDPHGNVYVTECYYHRIQKFTSDGDFISSWGNHGDGEGEMNRPMDVAIDDAGNVYVAECHNHRIQKFTSNGDFLSMWGSHGDGDGQFNCPISVSVDSNGNVYVVDYGNDRIQKFSSEGEFIAKLGSSGDGEGQFDHPEGIAVGNNGYIYVLDSGNNRIQCFAPKNPVNPAAALHPPYK